MHTLTNSAFLQSLGYAIANSLWQMAIVWVIYTGITNFIQLTARTKYVFAVGVQLTGFTWFAFTFQYYYFECLQAGSLAAAKGIAFVLPYNDDTIRSYLLSLFLRTEQLLPYLSVAYLLVLIVLFTKWINSYNTAQNLRKQGLHKIDVDLKLFVKQTAAYLGIKKEVKIFLSEYVNTPLTVGFLKPIILVPFASINYLNTEQMEAVLLHELAHIKRMDYLLNISLSIIETILFFNPFTQHISKSIKQEREHSCDDWVLQFQYNAATYAGALLKIASVQVAPAMAMTAVKSKNDLVSRVRRMIDKKNKPFNYRNQLISFLLITVVLASVAWLVPQRQKNNIVTQNTFTKSNQPIMLEPMAVKVNNPLFNPLFFFRKSFQDEIKRNIQIAEKDIAIASKEMSDLPAEVASVMPATIQVLEALNSEEDEDLDKNSNSEKLNNFPADLSKQKNKSTEFNEQLFIKDWEEFGKSMQQVGKEIKDAYEPNSKQKKSTNWQESFTNAFKQLQKLNIPFTNKKIINTPQLKDALKKTLTLVKAKQEAVKTKTINDSLKLSLNTKNRSVTNIEEDENLVLHNLSATVPAINYALNYSTNEVPVITTSTINNEVVTLITIKHKKKETEELNSKPKRYEVVVSNTGKADKKIIIEVL